MLVLLLKARKDKDVRKNNMSKYNLTDILEQYKIGSGWTSDFDYDGMLKAGLETGVDTDIEVLKKISDDFEDVNYHRENSHLQNAIEALEDGATKEASMFFGDFHAEIKATMKEQGMDIEPTVGQFMQNYIKEDLFSKDGDNEDNVDNIDKVASPDAKASDYSSAISSNRSEDSAEQAGTTKTTKPMYNENKSMSLVDLAKKLGIDVDELKDKVEKFKGKEKDEIEAGARASMAEENSEDKLPMDENKALGYLDKEVSDRIEGMLNIPMKKKFMEVGMDLIQDLIEEDPFEIDDIITHLANELGDYMDSFYRQGDRLAGIEIEENGDVKDYAEEIKEDDKKKLMDAAAKMIKDRILKDIPMDIVVDFVKTHFDDIKGMDNSEIEDEFENFRSVNYDYIDEDLKEHFSRFK